MKIPRINPRVARALILAVAAIASLSALLPDEASAAWRRQRLTEKNCSYGSGTYSWGACRGGQRCARGRNDEYYWEDDDSCPVQTQGGFPQV